MGLHCCQQSAGKIMANWREDKTASTVFFTWLSRFDLNISSHSRLHNHNCQIVEHKVPHCDSSMSRLFVSKSPWIPPWKLVSTLILLIGFGSCRFDRGERYWSGRPQPIGIDFSHSRVYVLLWIEALLITLTLMPFIGLECMLMAQITSRLSVAWLASPTVKSVMIMHHIFTRFTIEGLMGVMNFPLWHMNRCLNPGTGEFFRKACPGWTILAKAPATICRLFSEWFMITSAFQKSPMSLGNLSQSIEICWQNYGMSVFKQEFRSGFKLLDNLRNP